jgi:hypothetical protein
MGGPGSPLWEHSTNPATRGSQPTTPRDTREADPFPHIVLDDFINVDLARSLAAAFPGPDEISWVVRDNENNRRRYQHDETKVPTLLREMNGRFILISIRPDARPRPPRRGFA